LLFFHSVKTFCPLKYITNFHTCKIVDSLFAVAIIYAVIIWIPITENFCLGQNLLLWSGFEMRLVTPLGGSYEYKTKLSLLSRCHLNTRLVWSGDWYSNGLFCLRTGHLITDHLTGKKELAYLRNCNHSKTGQKCLVFE
jgi:hypothetical protein